MRILLTAVLLATLSGCAWLQSNVGAVLGASGAVAQSKTVRSEILDFLPPEKVAEIQSELVFFEKAYREITAVSADSSVIDLAKKFPDAIGLFEPNYLTITAKMNAHAEESGQPLPPTYVQFTNTVPKVWNDVKSAIQTNSRIMKAVEVFNAVKPLALLVL